MLQFNAGFRLSFLKLNTSFFFSTCAFITIFAELGITSVFILTFKLIFEQPWLSFLVLGKGLVSSKFEFAHAMSCAAAGATNPHHSHKNT